MAYLDYSPRVGRSQGASIFWGLVSVFFAAAACFYFWKNHENEVAADKYRDEVQVLQDERDTLNAEKQKLQASKTDAETELKTRADFLQDKENKLAAEEAHLDAMARQNPGGAAAGSTPAIAKKFTDTLKKIGKDDGNELITRGGRPVLRVQNSVFFASGDASLKPDGKTLLTQIAQSLGGQADSTELRIDVFTDGDSELQRSAGGAPKPSNVQKKDDAAKKTPDAEADAAAPHYANGWDLTAARALSLERFFHDQATLPFQNILVVARGDSQPVVTGAKDNHARNRRTEITATPVASPLHAESPVDPLAPPPDAPVPVPAPVKKDKT